MSRSRLGPRAVRRHAAAVLKEPRHALLELAEGEPDGIPVTAGDGIQSGVPLTKKRQVFPRKIPCIQGELLNGLPGTGIRADAPRQAQGTGSLQAGQNRKIGELRHGRAPPRSRSFRTLLHDALPIALEVTDFCLDSRTLLGVCASIDTQP